MAKIVIFLGFLLIILLFRIQSSQLSINRPPPSDLEEISLGNVMRQNLVLRINSALPNPQSALLSGMLIGEKSDLPVELTKALKNTSTIHIVVVSGQNLSLVAGFFLALAPILGRRKTTLISLLAVTFYLVLTGLQVPSLRAAVMVLLGSLAVLMGREKDSAWVLILTALLMLIYNPNWLFSISFQLSFLSTFGVIVVSPKIDSLLRLPDIIRQDLAVSLSAQLMTLPVIALNFHQISLVGVLVNALILWTVSPVMITGAVSLLIGFVSIVPLVLLTYFVYVVEAFNSLPFAFLEVGKSSLIVWVGYYLIISGGLIMLHLRNEQGPDSQGFREGYQATGV